MGGTLTFPDPPSAVIPAQPFSCRSALSPSLSGLLHGTEEERKRGKKEEWSVRGGTRKEVGGRSSSATAAMEPCGLVCFTLTVGSRLVDLATASYFSCLASEEFKRSFVQPVGSPVPGPLSQTACLSVSTCPPVEL